MNQPNLSVNPRFDALRSALWDRAIAAGLLRIALTSEERQVACAALARAQERLEVAARAAVQQGKDHA